MSPQTWIVLALALGAATYLVRSLGGGAQAKGCASGCGGCASKACGLRELEARQPQKG